MSPVVNLAVDADTGVARLELNRPDAANAINLELAVDLEKAAHALARDTNVRAVLLTGAGTRFCGGGDVADFSRQPADHLPDHLGEITAHLHPAVAALASFDAPVVAAVQGSAAGAGLGLVLAADIVIAARSTRFVMAYTGIGMSPDGSSSWFLPRIVGHRRATELALTNRVLSADEACDWGVVTTVVDDDALVSTAEELTMKLAGGPTAAYGRAARLLRASWDNTLDEQLTIERDEIMASGATADGREGINAFVAKRPPDFSGK
jgi:2-(1,2-epoxy-1,2-dihydrophenyl)acetyl-CoA isomerase